MVTVLLSIMKCHPKIGCLKWRGEISVPITKIHRFFQTPITLHAVVSDATAEGLCDICASLSTRYSLNGILDI